MSIIINDILYQIKYIFGNEAKVYIYPNESDYRVTCIVIEVHKENMNSKQAKQAKVRLMEYWQEEMPELLSMWTVEVVVHNV